MSKKKEVYFSYDNLKFMGVLAKKVYVRGYYFSKNNVKECILSFDKKLFKQTLNLWIRDKENYCERFGYFCGAMGSISSNNYTKGKNLGNLELYNIISIDNTTDMEHG